MSFPQVGVEAIVKGFDKFQGDMAKVRKEMADTGNQATTTSGTMGKAIGGLTGALGGMLVVAGGIIAADIFRAMASGLKDFAGASLEAASGLQQLEIRFNTLIARELASVNTGAGFSDWLRESTDLSDYAIQRYENLRAKHDELTTALEGVREGTTAWKNFTNQLEWTDNQIRELLPGFESMDARMQQAAFGTYSFSEALEQAQEPASALLDWAIKFGIMTPFTTETVSGAIALSMAMGYTSAQAKTLTESVANFTAGMGLSDDVMSRIIHNFGQMKAAGKVTGTELRDLARGGMVPVNDVLVQMQQNLGLTDMAFARFKKAAGEGQYGVQPFVDAFIQIIDRDFAGAAERLARTWTGATKNLKEFFTTVIGGQVLKPVIDDLSGALADLINVLSTPENVKAMKDTGLYLKTIWDNALGTIGALVGLDVEPSEGLKTFQDVIRKIAIAMLQINALATGKTSLRDMLDRLMGTGEIPPAWLTFMDFIGTFGTVLKPFADTFAAGIQGIIDALAKEAPAAGETIVDAIATILQGFSDWATQHEEQLATARTILDGFFTWLETKAIPALTGPGLTIAAAGITGLAQALGGLLGVLLDIGVQDWDAIMPDVEQIGAGLAKLPIAIADAILAMPETQDAFWISRLLYGNQYFGPPPESVAAGLGAWSGVWSMLQIIVNTGAANIATALYGIGWNIGTALARWATNAYASGQAVIQGIWNGMASKVEALKAQIEEWIEEVIALWNKLFRLHSPSKVMIEIGQNLVKGLQVGMGGQFSAAERVMSQGATGIQAAPMAMAQSPVTNNRTVNVGGVAINNGRDELWFDRQMRDWLGG